MKEYPIETVIPKHVAIIPDGNRRWARARGKHPWEGHRAGAENTENLIKAANNAGVKCLSFWGSSQDNLTKRPLEEKRALLEIYVDYFRKILDSEEVHRNKARIRVIGEWEKQFPDMLKKTIRECVESTKRYSDRMLNFFLAYNGDREMLSAIQMMLTNGVRPESVSQEVLKKYLWTKDLPPVDYLIRTGGEPHLSTGFMMWDTANAQLYFSEKHFPDFDTKSFSEALAEFSRRKRRLGA
jgi:undecaprenyl diphosphate synthase